MIIIIQLFVFRYSMRMGGDPFPSRNVSMIHGGGGSSPPHIATTTITTTTTTTTTTTSSDAIRRLFLSSVPPLRSSAPFILIFLLRVMLLPGVLLQVCLPQQ